MLAYFLLTVYKRYREYTSEAWSCIKDCAQEICVPPTL